ncbi:hypothetical protein BJV82DRAFT_100202 [Fennellomyces sp. T-0311]|nr:hypothetical protein BJV82DRAFT_100202 [Fennellomyces sp. T-0311]
MDQYQLFQLLTLWGRSLAELRLHLRNEYEEALPIGRILNMCPHIQMFDYRLDVGTFEHQRPNGPPLRALPHHLESLILIAPNIAAEILTPILRQCPRLETLQIENSNGAALRPILTHGLNLVNIAVNGHIPRMTRRPTSVANSMGLRKLGLHHIVGMRPADVIEILERCQTTVQAAILILQGESNDQEQHRWAGLANVRAVELKYLTYTAVSRDVHRYAAVMMRDCVNLESVTLSNIADLEGTTLEEALASLPHLRVFKLHHVANVNVDGLDGFFQAHARWGNSSSLRSVTLHTCRGITNDVMNTLSAIRTLQHLEIVDCPNAITTDGLLALARGLARSHSLRHVHFEEMVAVTDDVVRGFAAIAGLRTMSLSRLQTITADALEDIVYQNLSLQRVSINFCYNIGEGAIRNINAILAYRRH